MQPRGQVPTAPVNEGGAAGRACPNCGSERSGAYCARCGQSDRDYTDSFWSVVGDFLRETFEVDSRLFRTVKLLLFRPGRLSAEFSRNRRAGYMSPVRLYFFASILFFTVMSLATATPFSSGAFTVSVTDVARDTSDLADPTRELSADPPSPAADSGFAALRAALRLEQGRKLDDILNRGDRDATKQAMLKLASASEGAAELGPLGRFFFRFVLRGVIDLLHDPELIKERVLGNMSVAMFFLLPLYALLLALVYLNKKRFFVEHFVFSVHLQTFSYVVFSAALLMPDNGIGGFVQVGLILAVCAYYLAAFRHYYRDGWGWTVAKWFAVSALYSVLLLPAFLFAVLLAV